MASERRIDPFTRTPVLIAPGRRRVGDMRPGGLPTPDTRCPFCPGNESDTEVMLVSVGEPWRVRVVANRFPVTERGAHEVVVETPDHDADLSRYDAGVARELLEVLRARVRHHEARSDVRAVTVFRNRGRRAGSSQPHPHTQVLALDFVPPAMAMRDAVAASEPSLLRRVIDEERTSGARVVVDTGGWITFCPYAPARAFEVRLAPTEPTPRFSQTSDAQLDALAPRLVDAVARVLSVSGVSDYNVLVRDPAVGLSTFFTLDVLPRSGGDAGFEILSGTPIITVLPEETAAAMRALVG